LCFQIKRPLIIGSAIQWNGQLQVVDPILENEACYACIFDPKENITDAACGAYGVFAPAVGTIGVLQANEALKIAAGIRANVGKLLLFDALNLGFDFIKIKKRKDCPVCKKISKS
jgi:molybdopterin/thiamine biosynthesis adenylyltransferase